MKLLLAAWLIMWSLPAISQQYDTLPKLPDHYRKRVAKFRSEKKSPGAVLFLGNSLVEGGNWRKLLKDSSVVNHGISGDVSFGILKRIDAVARHAPSKVFLLIGANDLSKGIPPAVILENTFSIVNALHASCPKTQIFVQSVLPVNPGHKNFPPGYDRNSTIEEINGQLAKYADALKYTYVDIHSSFLSGQGLLDPRYTYDGFHLNQAGYVHWFQILKKQKHL